MTVVKFIRVQSGKVIEKGETSPEGFARYKQRHPRQYRVDTDDTPLTPIEPVRLTEADQLLVERQNVKPKRTAAKRAVRKRR